MRGALARVAPTPPENLGPWATPFSFLSKSGPPPIWSLSCVLQQHRAGGHSLVMMCPSVWLPPLSLACGQHLWCLKFNFCEGRFIVQILQRFAQHQSILGLYLLHLVIYICCFIVHPHELVQATSALWVPTLVASNDSHWLNRFLKWSLLVGIVHWCPTPMSVDGLVAESCLGSYPTIRLNISRAYVVLWLYGLMWIRGVKWSLISNWTSSFELHILFYSNKCWLLQIPHTKKTTLTTHGYSLGHTVFLNANAMFARVPMFFAT